MCQRKEKSLWATPKKVHWHGGRCLVERIDRITKVLCGPPYQNCPIQDDPETLIVSNTA
jgi:hypothetical protein